MGAQLNTLLLDDNNIGAVGAQHLSDGLSHCPQLRELGLSRNPIGIGFVPIARSIRKALVVLNASNAALTDVGAVAAGQALPGWPQMTALRLQGNKDISIYGAEIV